MNALALLLIGVYLILCAAHGQALPMYEQLGQEKKFLPWLLAVLILYALYHWKPARPYITPVIVLALLAVFLKQWPAIEKSLSELKL